MRRDVRNYIDKGLGVAKYLSVFNKSEIIHME